MRDRLWVLVSAAIAAGVLAGGVLALMVTMFDLEWLFR